MQPKPAQDWRVGEPVPPNYPWEPVFGDLYVIEIETLEDGRLKFHLSDGTAFPIRPDELVGFPRRIPGQPNEHGPGDPPRAALVAFGDVLPGGWRVAGVIPHSPRAMADGRWKLEHVDTGEIRWEVAGPFDVLAVGRNPWIARQGETPTERAREPWRGPYVSTVHDGVQFMLAVHPTGRGRWRAEIPVFQHHSAPGEYRSRPPKYRADWQTMAFKGTGRRHPDDPHYQP